MSGATLLPNSVNIDNEWFPECHIHYSESFKNRIYTLLLALKRNELKIPCFALRTG